MNSFLQSEIRLENALKFQPIFVEAFILFSFLWTFGSFLDDTQKAELDARLKEEIEPLKVDYASFQKKKKKQHKHNQAKSQAKAMGRFGPMLSPGSVMATAKEEDDDDES